MFGQHSAAFGPGFDEFWPGDSPVTVTVRTVTLGDILKREARGWEFFWAAVRVAF